MSYLVLARKSRPQTFDQVVGQKSVVKTLQNALEKDRVAHAILFSGVRGVGKTTLARIMAKAVNCKGESSSKPCDNCLSCTDIRTGNSLDLHEIDGASNRGIQEIRELKEKIKYLPTSSKYKIIIIDEVHMLTTEAFNALLKTLEEPPDHVFFIFATTEIHKIPITILSRCQRYELKRIPANELFQHLRKLSHDEGITIDESALNLIVREAEGSIRDGLSLLDQLFAYGEKNISVTDVTDVFGLVSRQSLETICSALLSGDHSQLLTTIDQLFSTGMDPRRLLNDLLDTFRSILLLKLDNCSTLLDIPKEEIHNLYEISSRYEVETIHMKLNLLMGIAEKLSISSQPRLTLETMLINVIEAGNITPVSKLIGKVSQLLNNENSLQVSAKIDPIPKKNQSSNTHGIPEKIPDQKKKVPETEKAQAVLSEKPYITSAGESDTEQQLKESNDEPAGNIKIITESSEHEEKSVRKHWREFVNYVSERKIWMGQDLQRIDKAVEKDNELHLFYQDAVNCRLLMESENHKLLTALVLDFFQKDLKLRFIVNDNENDPDLSEDDGPRKKRAKILNDPLVTMVTEVFNGQTGDVRVGPVSK